MLKKTVKFGATVGPRHGLAILDHQIQWLGQAGFRLRVHGPKRDLIVYVDPYLQNPMMPSHLRREFSAQVVPSDANLILITHAMYEHLACAIPILLSAEDPECRIACVPEIAQSILSTGLVSASKLLVINLGGSVDVGYVTISNVHANHSVWPELATRLAKENRTSKSKRSSEVKRPPSKLSGASSSPASSTSGGSMSFAGGASAGWVIQIANNGPIIYHTGDTNVLNDISMVNQLYRPTHVLLPVGSQCSLTPESAAQVCRENLTNCHTVIPMLFKSAPVDSFTSVLAGSDYEEAQGFDMTLDQGFRELALTRRKSAGCYTDLVNSFGGEHSEQLIVDSEQQVLGKWYDLIA